MALVHRGGRARTACTREGAGYQTNTSELCDCCTVPASVAEGRAVTGGWGVQARVGKQVGRQAGRQAGRSAGKRDTEATAQ
jgi:hypothetical protein